MNQDECFHFIGKYIVNSSLCEEKIALLIATKEYTAEIINEFGFYQKIEILKFMLKSRYSKFIDLKYNLITELHEIRKIRNDFAHGVIHLAPSVIRILKLNEIYEEGVWGQNYKEEYQISKIPEIERQLDTAMQKLLRMWADLSREKRFQNRP